MALHAHHGRQVVVGAEPSGLGEAELLQVAHLTLLLVSILQPVLEVELVAVFACLFDRALPQGGRASTGSMRCEPRCSRPSCFSLLLLEDLDLGRDRNTGLMRLLVEGALQLAVL